MRESVRTRLTVTVQAAVSAGPAGKVVIARSLSVSRSA